MPNQGGLIATLRVIEDQSRLCDPGDVLTAVSLKGLPQNKFYCFAVMRNVMFRCHAELQIAQW